MPVGPAPVLVIGPGALGTLIAARLHSAGAPVLLACRSSEAARFLAEKGLEATDETGRRLRAHVPTLSHADESPAQASLVVLATKCADAPAALRHWLPAVLPHAPVVALQNGVVGDGLAALSGQRYVECTVSFPATLEGPGMSVQTGPGHLLLGPWPRGVATAAVSEAARVLAPAAPVETCTNMLGVKWSKLLINSCISSLGVAAGVELGVLLQDRRARQAFLRIAEEGNAAGLASGVRFETVAGFRPWMFARSLPGRHALLRIVARRQGRHKSSSLQSLERGQRTEVDFLNGHIVAAGREHGVPTPVNEALVDLVHSIEEGNLQPALGNLERLPV